MKYLTKNRKEIYTPAQSPDCLAFGEKPSAGEACQRPHHNAKLDQELANSLIKKEFK